MKNLFKKPKFKPSQLIWYINYDVVNRELKKPGIEQALINTVSYNKKYTWYALHNGKVVDDYLCFNSFDKATKYLCKFKESLKDEHWWN